MNRPTTTSARAAAVASFVRRALPRRGMLLTSWTAAAVGCVTMAAPIEPDDFTSTAFAAPSCARDPELGVILVAIDGVRWQDIYRGTDPDLVAPGSPLKPAEALAPHIHALARRGVALGAPGHGAPFEVSGPNFVSLPGYTEMLTGRTAPCQENDCTERPSWTLLDAFASKGRPVGAVSSWSAISYVVARDPALGLVSAGRTGGGTRDRVRELPGLRDTFDAGEAATPEPGHGDYRPDAHTRALALGVLRRERPRFFFAGLGDTDEHAHAGNYPAYLDALGTADRFVGDVMELADEWRRDGRETVIVVTTDHGRSADFRNHGRDYPESSRGWLVAGGGPVPARGYVASSHTRRLRDLAPTVAAMAGVPVELGSDGGAVMNELLACP